MSEHALELLLDQLADRIARRLIELQQAERQHTAEESGGASPWLSVKSAAAYLDWPAQRLYKLTAQGAIPHFKHEGRLLFHRAELDHWLTQHAQPGDWIPARNRAISP
jgi:excisionase family DNA binding protein